MTSFLFCLAWGMLAFFFVLLVRIGARPVPKPPELPSPRDVAAYRGEVILSGTHTGPELGLR
jgi:hypothetical protein